MKEDVKMEVILTERALASKLTPDLIFQLAKQLVEGRNHSQIAADFTVTRRTIINWSKDSRVRAAVEDLSKGLIGIHQEAIREEVKAGSSPLIEQLETFCERQKARGREMTETADDILALGKQVIAQLKPEDISAKSLPMLLRIASELQERGLQMESQALAVDEVLKRMMAVQVKVESR